MRLGLFGGTFDPIHLGHLDVARAARRALALDCVWFIPSRVPPHRTLPQCSAAHRFAMVALAIEGEEGLLVSDLEMMTDGVSYSVESLDRVQALGFDSASLFFVTGADAFRDIASWRGYPHILDRCHFVVVSRPGYSAALLSAALPELKNRMMDAASQVVPARPHILLVDAPTAAVSSTDVRRAMLSRMPLDGLVPTRVAAYIGRHALYADMHALKNDPKGAA